MPGGRLARRGAARHIEAGTRTRRMDAIATSASPSAIAVERLRKVYKGVVAVDGISFALAPGSITGLLGGNGAGKTPPSP